MLYLDKIEFLKYLFFASLCVSMATVHVFRPGWIFQIYGYSYFRTAPTVTGGLVELRTVDVVEVLLLKM